VTGIYLSLVLRTELVTKCVVNDPMCFTRVTRLHTYSKFWDADRLAVDLRQVRDTAEVLMGDVERVVVKFNVIPTIRTARVPPSDLAQHRGVHDDRVHRAPEDLPTGLVAVSGFIHPAHLTALVCLRRLSMSIVTQPPFFPSHRKRQVPDRNLRHDRHHGPGPQEPRTSQAISGFFGVGVGTGGKEAVEVKMHE